MPGSFPSPDGFPAAVKDYLVKAVSKIQEPDLFKVQKHLNWPVSCYVRMESLRPYGQVQFALVEMTGCCMYLVSTATFIDGCYKRKGLSYVLQKAKEDLARQWGYTKLFCTITMDNVAELRVLKKCDWEQIDEGTNIRTMNRVGMFVKELALL